MPQSPTPDDNLLVQLAMECMKDSRRWFPDTSPDLVHHTLSLCGEVGEFANILKKVDRGDLNYNDAVVKHKLAMELTDVFIYLLNIAGLMRVNLHESYKVKRQENERRFGPNAGSRNAANGQ